MPYAILQCFLRSLLPMNLVKEVSGIPSCPLHQLVETARMIVHVGSHVENFTYVGHLNSHYLIMLNNSWHTSTFKVSPWLRNIRKYVLSTLTLALLSLSLSSNWWVTIDCHPSVFSFPMFLKFLFRYFPVKFAKFLSILFDSRSFYCMTLYY